MDRKRVLVIGSVGYIASQLLPAFRERYDLTLVDVRETDREGRKVEGIQIADLSDPDLEKNRSFFRGVKAVVHLGYKQPGPEGWLDYYTERTNIDMAYNVYRLSLEEGVERVVVASSNHAGDWYEKLVRQKLLDVVTPEMRPLSDNFYGWAKIAYEAMGFVFASGAFGRKLPVVLLRIGAPRPLPREKYLNNPQGYIRDLGAWISQRDLQQLFIKSLETPNIENEYGIPYQIFYGISGNTRRFWSIVNARRVIGYDPQDDSEVVYAEDINALLKRGG